MRTVYKYPMQMVTGHQIIRMPSGANVLACQIQGADPQLWAEVSDENDMVDRWFIIVGTGRALPRDVQLRFIDTFQMINGDLIFHVFEVST